MKQSIENDIFRKIKYGKRGNLYFPSDFIHLDNVGTINKTLSRMAKRGEVIRLAQGIYLYPKKDPLLGILYPTTEEIAQAIAKRDHARIRPTGVQALQRLGFSTQVPMNAVYFTDGSPRKIKVGNRTITFKKITPKMLAIKNSLMLLIISALQEIGVENITPDIRANIKLTLNHMNREVAMKDTKFAPAAIARFIYDLIKENDAHGLVTTT